MPMTISRTDHGSPGVEAADLERYVQDRAQEMLAAANPGLMVETYADWMSDYWRVELFVVPLTALPQAETAAARLQEELQGMDVPVYVHARSWTV